MGKSNAFIATDTAIKDEFTLRHRRPYVNIHDRRKRKPKDKADTSGRRYNPR
jgi:hypothetical protein